MHFFRGVPLYFVSCCVVLISLPAFINASNILFLVGVTAKSHMTYVWSIIEILNSHGHQVTVVSPIINTKGYPNISQFEMTESKIVLEELYKKVSGGRNKRILDIATLELTSITLLGNLFFKHPFVKKLLKEKPKYDLVIVDSFMNQYVLPVAHVLNTPVAYVVASPLDVMSSFMLSIPHPFSYVPLGLVRFPEKSTFFQRLLNSIYHTVCILFTMYEMTVVDSLVANYIPDSPSIDELRKNISIALVNSDPITDNPRPNLPNIISTSCLHCRAAKPLPKHIDDFMESSGEHGVILFSMGTILSEDFWPKNSKEAFIWAFSKLKQKVIWKYNKPISGLSDNVMVMDWVPQQDILGHPKLRLFIGHGGYLGIQEAIYHSVPIIGIPMFALQPQHVTRAVEMGFGEYINFLEITKTDLLHKIQLVLNNPKYRKEVSKYSHFYRTSPQSSSKNIMFWIDHVIQHKGAHHLIPASRHLSVLQYYLIDILAFVIAILVISVAVCFFILKLIIRIFRKTRKYKSE